MSALPSGELTSELTVDRLEYTVAARAERVEEKMGRHPTLSIISAYEDHGPSMEYMGRKKTAGERLGVTVLPHVYKTANEAIDQVHRDADNPDIDGIIVQLPLSKNEQGKPAEEQHQTTQAIEAIPDAKDVDGLKSGITTTGDATLEYLRGQGIKVTEHTLVFVGLGRLVNGPLHEHFSALIPEQVKGIDLNTDPLDRIAAINDGEILFCATGHAGLMIPELFLPDTGWKFLVDAGKAEKGAATAGDVSDELRAWGLGRGWAMTPKTKGIGPLTVGKLMERTVKAAEKRAGITEPIGIYMMNKSLAATSSNRSTGGGGHWSTTRSTANAEYRTWRERPL